MKSITFLYPCEGSNLSGGLKVACEYANRLAEDGFEVHVAYAGSIFYSKKSLFHKLTGIYRYFEHWIKGYSCTKWFNLNKKVKEHWCLSLNKRHVPQTDIYVCTSPYTAMYLDKYEIDNSRKFYFIQAYENWGDVTDKMLRETYHYDMTKIVIAEWLRDILTDEGVACHVVHNGFNFNEFGLKTDIKAKDKFKIGLLYHRMEIKGLTTSFKALDIVHSKYPQLKVDMFGFPEEAGEIKDWYKYTSQPSKQTLNNIYDTSAIFIGASKQEGWGLTIGEAMMCGCAVACTDNDGYKEMAHDEDTALLSHIGDAEGLAKNIIRLIEDDELRHRIAESGHNNIKQFTWESSYAKYKKILMHENY